MEETTMKELMVRFPVIELKSGDFIQHAKHYPNDGMYIVICADHTISLVEVELQALGVGELRCSDELCMTFRESMILGENVVNPKDMVPASLLKQKEQEWEVKVKAAQAEAKDAKENLLSEQSRLTEKMEAELASRSSKLEHEYEIKKLRLELEQPKRFGQGEWVSGNTLKDIIKTLVGSNDSAE